MIFLLKIRFLPERRCLSLTKIVQEYRMDVRVILRSSLLFHEKKSILFHLTHHIEILCQSFSKGWSSSFSFDPEEREEFRILYEELKELLARMGVPSSSYS